MRRSYYYAHAQPLTFEDWTDPDHSGAAHDRYFYLHDRLGSVRLLIDEAAAVAAAYTYDPYGRTLEQTHAPAAPANPLRFTGQWFDEEISQYHLRARQYDPALMRFTTRDPVTGGFEDPMTLHRYLYCVNDPINYVDYSGEFFTLPDLTLGTALQMGLRGYGAYHTANRIKGYAEMVVAGVGMKQILLTVAADAAMDYVGGKVASAAIKGLGSVAKQAGKGLKGLRRLFEKHHLIPKFLGGAVEGELAGLSKELHRGKGPNSFHNILRKHLKETFGDEMPSNLSGKKFEKLFQRDPMNHTRAMQALVKASQEFDQVHGGDIMTTAVIQEITNQGFSL